MSKIDGSILIEDNERIEVIVKYTGDLEKLSNNTNIEIEILSCNYAIFTLNKSDIDSLLQYNEIDYVEKSKELTLELNESKNNICYNNIEKDLNIQLTGKGVLIGIIDSGIDYTHNDFRNIDGTTRIKYIWDLSIDGNPPIGSNKGSIYTEEDINLALKGEKTILHNDFINHGTPVAGICAGNGNNSNGDLKGVAPDAELIIVKVNDIFSDGFAKNTDIMRAIKFIIEISIKLEKPVAINISFGTNDGAHDGSSLFEIYIDEMCDTYKNNIVIATGNEGGSAHHYFGVVENNKTETVEFQTSKTLNTFNMSIWKSFSDEIKIELIASNGDSTGLMTEKSGIYEFALGKYKVIILFSKPTPYNVDQEVYFKFEKLSEVLQNEIWFLKMAGDSIVDGNINIWLPVVEQSGSETFFFQPSLNTTLTIPSTSNKCISVGGYNTNLNTFATFSGRGFDRKGMVKPDLVAPAVDVISTSVGGGYNSFTGTSFAAPYVTGSIALMLEWGIVNGNDVFLYGQRSKALLRRGSKRNKDVEYPNMSYGYGTLCIGDSIVLDSNNIDRVTNNDNINLTENSENETVDNPIENNYNDDFLYLIIEFGEVINEIIKSYDYITLEKNLTGNFAIVKLPYDRFEEFESKVGNSWNYELPSVLTLCGKSSIQSSGIYEAQTQNFLQLDGRGTMIAIIDTGIDYTNKVFVYEDNTSKIEYIWDMTIEGNPPEGFNFGTEYTNEDINKALKSENSYEIVPSRDKNGHGTFMASIASGRKDSQGNIGASPESKLIVVKLRQSNNITNKINYIQKTNKDIFQSTDIALALEYVIQKQKQIQKPLSIGLFQGTNTGSHDGKSLFERYIEQLGFKIGIFLSIANGNEADKRHHIKKTIPTTGAYVDIELKVGDKERKFFIDMWGYASDKTSLSIFTPLGETTGKIDIKSGVTYTSKFVLEDSIVDINYNVSNIGNGNQRTKIGFTSPTQGVWIIRVYGENIINGIIHAWLPTSDLISEETYFPIADPEYTITVPATADGIVSTGGYNHLDDSLLSESGRGPNKNFVLKPTLVAPAVNVVGQYPYGIGTMTGTSVANAHVVGAASLLMQWAVQNKKIQKINTITIGSVLIGGCEQFEQLKLMNILTGFGRMNLINSFKNLKI